MKKFEAVKAWGCVAPDGALCGVAGNKLSRSDIPVRIIRESDYRELLRLARAGENLHRGNIKARKISLAIIKKADKERGK